MKPSSPMWMQVVLCTTLATLSAPVQAAGSKYNTHQPNFATKVWRGARKLVNFSGLIGSPTSALPYDRVAGHPVFAITTPWGSPYMNMEKLSDLEEVVQEKGGAGNAQRKPTSISEEQNEVRTVALYFLDPDDCLSVHGEMKQLDQMQKTDIRLTAFSLAKALRQASNVNNGLPTGMPPDPLTGNLPTNEGGALRYKIVPPKRQLYYAARCIGKERVGLFGDSPFEDAQTAVLGNSALESMNLARRRERRERKTPKSQPTALQRRNAHMEGYTGIPVFTAPEMRRQLPLLKRLLSGNGFETPFFFNYEDLMEAWKTTRGRPNTATTPAVEVFNLWDVLTSMDRDACRRKFTWKEPLQHLRHRVWNDATPDLRHITFVPSSRSVEYKESISARGNGKARLRPMR